MRRGCRFLADHFWVPILSLPGRSPSIQGQDSWDLALGLLADCYAHLYLIECKENLSTGYREARAGLHPEPDSCELGLLYMATARAYFQGSHRSLPSVSGGSLTVLLVAFKRFTNIVPMMIDQVLLLGLDWDRGLNYRSLTLRPARSLSR